GRGRSCGAGMDAGGNAPALSERRRSRGPSMKCPACQAENLGDSLFCEECSAPLEASCPQCGTGNRLTAKFCRKCRAPLVGAGAAPDPRAFTTPKHLADKILQSKS